MNATPRPVLDASNSRWYRSRAGVPKQARIRWDAAEYTLVWGRQRFDGPHVRVTDASGDYGVDLQTFFRTEGALANCEDHYVKVVKVLDGDHLRAQLVHVAYAHGHDLEFCAHDLQRTPVNRVVGAGQLVDELHTTFIHSRPMPWLLPNVAPTHKKIDMDIVVVVQFRVTSSRVSGSIGTTPPCCGKPGC